MGVGQCEGKGNLVPRPPPSNVLEEDMVCKNAGCNANVGVCPWKGLLDSPWIGEPPPPSPPPLSQKKNNGHFVNQVYNSFD